ncbi:hypothetical protein OG474_01465 [Kribbella sp. NBC_01505]|uniref:hypothetical protein n=1 Tax=Kribbella sp. NBC_01505 TaxID=2903580 RepID=UPI00386C6205
MDNHLSGAKAPASLPALGQVICHHLGVERPQSALEQRLCASSPPRDCGMSRADRQH